MMSLIPAVLVGAQRTPTQSPPEFFYPGIDLAKSEQKLLDKIMEYNPDKKPSQNNLGSRKEIKRRNNVLMKDTM